MPGVFVEKKKKKTGKEQDKLIAGETKELMCCQTMFWKALETFA